MNYVTRNHVCAGPAVTRLHNAALPMKPAWNSSIDIWCLRDLQKVKRTCPRPQGGKTEKTSSLRAGRARWMKWQLRCLRRTNTSRGFASNDSETSGLRGRARGIFLKTQTPSEPKIDRKRANSQVGTLQRAVKFFSSRVWRVLLAPAWVLADESSAFPVDVASARVFARGRLRFAGCRLHLQV